MMQKPFSFSTLLTIATKGLLYTVALLAASLAYSALSVGLGWKVRFGPLLFVLFVELILAFGAYVGLRLFRLRRPMLIMALIPSLLGLVGGWNAGYRIAGGSCLSDYWHQTNQQLRNKRGSELSSEESAQLYSRVMADPQFFQECHKIAAQHSIPAFAVVFLVMLAFTRKERVPFKKPRVL